MHESGVEAMVGFSPSGRQLPIREQSKRRCSSHFLSQSGACYLLYYSHFGPLNKT